MSSKSWLEVIIMPLVIAIVGSLGTYFITLQQERSSEAQSKSERELKIVEIFSEKISSKDINERRFAVNLLKVLDPELAEKLAEVVVESESERSEIKIEASKIASDFKSQKR